jgi:hypothetical protein
VDSDVGLGILNAHSQGLAEDLPLIRQLLTEEEYALLLRRLVRVMPDGPLLDPKQVFGEPGKN